MTELQVIFMDAGQGDCTLVLFPDGQTNWLIDCGSIKNGQVVIPQILEVLARELQPRGNKIDCLILTHPDQDHYNLLNIIDQIGTNIINEVVYGGELADYANQVDGNYTYQFLCEKRDQEKAFSPDKAVDWWPQNRDPHNIGGAQVYFLAANAGEHQQGRNNDSIVLLVGYQGYKFFLMGDAEEYTERFILKYWPTLRSQSDAGVCLKLGHHGSESGTTEEWVNTIKPTALVVSSDTRGFGPNERGMPALSKIKNAVNWSGQVVDLSFQHNYVVWCDEHDNCDYKFKPMQVGPTHQAICTTLYHLKYNDPPKNTKFEAIGGSWYFLVQDNGTLNVAFTGAQKG